MSRTSLSERIPDPVRTVPPRGGMDLDRAVLIGRDAVWSHAAVLAAAAQAPLSEARTGRAVALMLDDPIRTALALVALDGQVERLLVLSAETPADVADGLLSTFAPDIVLTDRLDRTGGSPAVGAARWLEWTGAAIPADRADTTEAALPGRHDTLWALATSGTTGRPKLVAHRLASLTRTTRVPAVDAAPLRFGQIYDMARFAGIQVFLQGLLGGGGLVLTAPGQPLGERLALMAERGCDALSATPTYWRKILMLPESTVLSLRQVTLGGEAADDAVLAALRTRFPDARLVHVYASTEAGAAFSVKDGKAGFPRRFLDEPPGGIRLAIRDGRLFIQNGQVLPTYLGQDLAFADADGFVDTGDQVAIVDDRVIFRGRANGTINVGGNKLFPEEVERVLLADERVRLARVFAKRSPITGHLVAAEIVAAGPADQMPNLVPDLMARCRSRLERWQVPALIRCVDDIAVNAGGKVGRVRP